MTIHLVTNASVLESPGTFQKNVYTIHSLGKLLPLVEWTFIFIPILFHAIVGTMIAAGMIPNTRDYPYGANRRYTWQRWTGLIAFAFILYHVFHMHGWFHFHGWLEHVAKPFDGAQFKPYNAASSAGEALQSPIILGVYAVGVLACIFHFANGLWTMGITWGVWTTAAAQRRANWICLAFGLGLVAVGLGALVGATGANVPEAEAYEQAHIEAQEAEMERARALLHQEQAKAAIPVKK
jgi:succinate dehydrogenase / fumarate reductase cytochrome b subunit